MAIDFGTIIAGPYAGTYNAVDIGATINGWEYGNDYSAEMVNQTDLFGDMLIDMVYRGGNAKMRYEALSYKSGSVSPFWPWGALYTMFTAAAPIARTARSVAQAFVLTSVANTPSAATPTTLTAGKSILSPNTSGKLLFDSKKRTVAVELTLLPYESAVTGTAIVAVAT